MPHTISPQLELGAGGGLGLALVSLELLDPPHALRHPNTAIKIRLRKIVDLRFNTRLLLCGFGRSVAASDNMKALGNQRSFIGSAQRVLVRVRDYFSTVSSSRLVTSRKLRRTCANWARSSAVALGVTITSIANTRV